MSQQADTAQQTRDFLEPLLEGDMPKEWELSDDFEEAPKKPEGNSWKVLLDPLMEKENIRCNAWKDEVQNLLIFAGLFSAVITAFVIESYKNLQRDPNADIVTLLSHIASRLDNPLNSSTTQFSLSTSFSPEPAAVRVNILWFLSLILSLTAVLVGIISLQWLREYQSYPGRSIRDTLAIYRMRAEGLEKWHVRKIFTALPLLLQAALVLFFAGVIDFLHNLGNMTVIVPVALAIGITLLFLLATTFLPAYQNLVLQLWFLISRRRQRPPSQCPYKSPQSGAFFAAFFAALRLFGLLFSSLFGSSIFRRARTSMKLNTFNTHILHHLSRTWSQENWTEYDMAWLSIRDTCQEFYIGNGNPNSGSQGDNPDSSFFSPPFPLFDLTQMLREAIGHAHANHTEEFLSAVYYCFNDLSRAFLRRDRSLRENTDDEVHQRFDWVLRRNNYFHLLLCNVDATNPYLFCPPSPVYFIDFERVHYLATFDLNIDILHHQNLFMFLDHLIKNYSRALVSHRAEIMIRLAKALYQKHTVLPQADSGSLKPLSSTPAYLRGDIGFFDYLNYNSQTNKSLEFKMFFQQYCFMLIEFFEHASKPHGQPGHSACLHSHENTLKFMETASVHAYIAIAPYIDESDPQDRRKRMKSLTLVLKSICTSLERALLFDRQRESMSLFYTAAIFVRCLYCLMLSQDSQDQGYNHLLAMIRDVFAVLRKYKNKTLDLTEFRSHLEEQFKGRDTFYYETSFSRQSSRFSPEWWSFLDGKTSNCRVPLSIKLQVAMAGRLHRPKFKMGKLVNTLGESPNGLGVHLNNPVSLLRALVMSSAGNLRARLHTPLRVNSDDKPTSEDNQPNDKRIVEPVSDSAANLLKTNSESKIHSLEAPIKSDPGSTDPDPNKPKRSYVGAPYESSQQQHAIHHSSGPITEKLNPGAHDLV